MAHLVQKFLKKFRPADCWPLTYSETCSKPRVGEFGGGALFVTATDVKWQSAFSFIEQERRAFEQAVAYACVAVAAFFVVAAVLFYAAVRLRTSTPRVALCPGQRS